MKLVAFDSETWGKLPEYALQPFRARTGDAWLTSFAVASDTSVRGTLKPSKAQLRGWLQSMARADVRVVGWNTPFDLAWLIALGLKEEVLACKWLDAMLLWRQLEVRPDFTNEGGKRQSFSLKNAVREYVPEYADYEKGVSFDPNENPEQLLEYNKLDSMLTLKLARMFWDRMTPEMRRIAQIEAAALPVVAEAIVEGLHIDTNAAHELDKKLEDAANVAFVTLKVSDSEAITPEVLASPMQLAELLFEKWGLTPTGFTDKGAPSTDKESLWKLAHFDPRAKLVRDYREANNNRKKFVTSTLESLTYNGDGVTRPQPRIASTYTARMTYSSKQGKGKSERPIGVAIHQWKRGKEFRKLIIPPPGYVLGEFDFAGQEFRWMAVMSGDPIMLKLCAPGEDAHGYMGSRIAGWTYEDMRERLHEGDADAKARRQLGKVANLSCQYRTSAARLLSVAQVQYDLPMTLGEAKIIHTTYRTTYRHVQEYWRRQVAHAKRNGYVENLIGRRVYLGEPHTWNHALNWSYESTAINFPIQSIGADQKYLAILVLRDLLKEFDSRFYLELHDGLYVIIPEAKAAAAAVKIKHVLSNLPYRRAWGVDLPIKFPVGAKLGRSWGDLKEIEE